MELPFRQGYLGTACPGTAEAFSYGHMNGGNLKIRKE